MVELGMGNSAKMFAIAVIVSTCLALSGAVTPLTPEELQHIREFTAKAHMKRAQNYPDQIMTASSSNTHYVGRRIPQIEKPPPTFFMQAPSNHNQVVKPTQFTVGPQAGPPGQNNLIYYPISTGGPPGPIFQQRPHPQQLQFINIQQGPTPAQSAQIAAAGGQLRGPGPQQPQHAPQQFNNNQGPPQQFNQGPGPQQFQQGPGPQQFQQGPGPQQFNKRPNFFSFPEQSPHTSIFSFFFPRRPARRPNFRTPLRFEFGNAPQQQHPQNSPHGLPQHQLLTIHQNAQGQLQIQPSNSPLTAQSTTIKSGLGVQNVPTAGPSPAGQVLQTATLVPLPARLVPANSLPLIHTNGPPPNQFHREISFFGKPFGKPRPPQKYHPVNGQFIPQNRPGDGQQYVQKYVGPQHDFSFLPFGPHAHPIVAGPTSHRFNGGGSPVSFSHIEQLPFALQRPQSLPMPMIVQSQEFPHYHFTTQFATGGQNQAGKPPAVPQNILKTSQSTVSSKSKDAQSGADHEETPNMRPQRVRKVKPRITVATTTTTTNPPPSSSTAQSLGDIIFESSKETREFHDTARLVASPSLNYNSNNLNNEAKNRKPKQQNPEAGSSSGVENSVVLAPLVFARESSEPISSTTSARPPLSSTSVSISTVSTTTEEPYKSKIVKSKGVDFHKTTKNVYNHNFNHNHNHHNHNHAEKKVTASGSGLVVTAEPMRVTSTGAAPSSSTSSRHTASPGRVVTTSVTSRVVSTGSNPNKRYRLRKVKLPNPEAKNNKHSISSTSSFSNTTIIPSTTSVVSSSRPGRSTTTLSSSTVDLSSSPSA